MEEKRKKNIIRWLMIIIIPLFLLPLIFVLTVALLNWFGWSHPLVFLGLMGGSPIVGTILAVGVYIALVVWLSKKKFNVILRVVVLLTALVIVIAFILFAFYFFSIMTDSGLR
jgi:hypothetical protein